MENANDQELTNLRLIHARLERFYREQNYQRSSFASAVGEHIKKLNRGLEGQSGSADFLVRTKTLFPTLNLRWLLTGKGKMYQGDHPHGNQKLTKRQEDLGNRIAALETMPSDNASTSAKKVEAIVSLLPELLNQRLLLDAKKQDAQLATLAAYKAQRDANR